MSTKNEDYSPEVIVDNLRPTTPEFIPDAIEETPIDPNFQVMPEEEPLPPFVLGRVKGVFMGPFSVINGNGRIYLPEIMDAILSDPYIVQMMGNKCLLGEAHHPSDKRSSLWLDEATISVTRLWKEGMYLMGEADILDTPKGRIVWALVKYGSKLGVSARASGKGVKGTYRGQRAEIIKPENYELKGFDVVLNPGFPAARPDFNSTNEEQVTEESSLVSELKSLITESRVDKDMVRGFINYSEDESLKSLLPMLEEDTPTESMPDTTDVNAILEENENLKNAYKNLEVLVDSLREECLNNNSGASDEIVNELMTKLESIERVDTSKYESQIEELMTMCESGNEENASLTEENYDLHLAYEQLDEELQELKNEKLSLQEYLDSMSVSKAELESQIETLNEELKELREYKEEKESAIVTEESEEGFNVDFIYEEKKSVPKISIPAFVDMSSSILGIVNEEQEFSERRALINHLGGK